MGVEVEGIARGDDQAIEVGDAEDEGAGPIGESAGCAAKGCSGLEQAGVDGGRNGLAEDGTEGAADDVGALTGREVDWIEGAEVEAESVELESGHNEGGGPARSAPVDYLLMYNGKAFDSCFPLRTEFERGLRESIRAPFFCLEGANES